MKKIEQPIKALKFAQESALKNLLRVTSIWKLLFLFG